MKRSTRTIRRSSTSSTTRSLAVSKWRSGTSSQSGKPGRCTRPRRAAAELSLDKARDGTEESVTRRPFAFIGANTSHGRAREHSLRAYPAGGLRRAGELAVHVARICVLFEELRLESS